MTTKDEPNNPAGRLHGLLLEADRAAKSLARARRRSGQPAKSPPIKLVLADVLGIEPTDRGNLLRRYAEIITLPVQVREGIEAIPAVNPEVTLAHLDKFEAAFAYNSLEAGWGDLRGKIDDTAMYSLQVCDDYLSRHARETIIPQQRREELRTQVQALREEVEADERDPDLRSFIVEHLLQIEQALLAYRIAGTPPIRAAVATVLGDAAIRQAEGRMPRDNPRMKKLGALAAGILLTLNIAKEGLQLTERVFTGGAGELPTVEAVDAEPTESAARDDP